MRNIITKQEDEKNYKKALKINNKAMSSLDYASKQITPKDCYYGVQYALHIIANINLDLNTTPMWHIFHKNTVVTIFQAIKWLKADYKKHPSKKRKYQLLDLQVMRKKGYSGFFSCFYKKDSNVMSRYLRLQCQPAEYKNVIDIINSVKSAINEELYMYQHALERRKNKKTVNTKKLNNNFQKMYEENTGTAKAVLPF